MVMMVLAVMMVIGGIGMFVVLAVEIGLNTSECGSGGGGGGYRFGY